MPHDIHGDLIEVGDIIKVQAYVANAQRTVIGPVQSISASETCSGKVLVPVIGGFDPVYFDANKAKLLLKADGTDVTKPE